MELRRAIVAEIDMNPDIDHLAVRRKFQVGEAIVESALTKSLVEWDALLGATPPDPAKTPVKEKTSSKSEAPAPGPGITMPGLEQGIVKFTRKPAKMGMDFIFWVPRVYIKNGLVDPTCEYEVYLKKLPKE
jgi:hypothetical protein